MKTFLSLNFSSFRFQSLQSQQQPTIDEDDLTLTEARKYEVAGGTSHYRQFIRYRNGRLCLLTPNFHAWSLRVNEHGNSCSVLIPIDAWIRQQLNVAEKFATQNVVNHSVDPTQNMIYKRLWIGDMMYISVASWCQIFKKNRESGQYETVDIKALGRGTYTVTIEVPYIFIGPHKNGEDFSLTLRIVQITFDPEVEDRAKPVTIPLTPSKAPTTKGRRRKNVAAKPQHEDFDALKALLNN